MDSALARPTPPKTPESERFWSAANEGRFLFGSCRSCNKPHYYPRAICPFCFSADVEWKESAGKGEVHSFTPVRKAVPPYVAAYVTLAEGVTVLTHLVDCEPDEIGIGMAVAVAYEPNAEGQAIPVFRPAGKG